MKVLNWRKRVAAALAACGIAVPTSALAAELQVNLVANPNFELVDTMDPGPNISVRILDWVDADGDGDDTYAYLYSLNYSGIPAPPGSASYHFTGGFNTTTGQPTITQSFDVSAGDSGNLIATGTALPICEVFSAPTSNSPTFRGSAARFLSGSMTGLGSAEIGGADFLAGLPVVDDRTYWGQDAAVGIIPTGTATVAIDVVADFAGGNYDGYVDLVDFRVGGMANDAAVAPQVNTTTGQARFNNLTGDPVDFKYYEISSASGSLDPTEPNGWASLQDQDLSGFPAGNGTGNGWEEAGGVSAHILAESYWLNHSTLADQQKVNLGSPYVVGTEDLVFRYGLADGLLLYGVVEYLTDFGLVCDFDGSGACDIDDIDDLVAEIVAGTNGPIYDLNGDSLVTLDDVTDENLGWLRLAGEENIGPGKSYLPADITLDTIVDGLDFIEWNGNKFVSTGLWSLGDVNADGVTDGLDFIIWNGVKFTSSDGIAAVPEPGGVFLAGLGVASIGWLRRGKAQRCTRRNREAFVF